MGESTFSMIGHYIRKDEEKDGKKFSRQLYICCSHPRHLFCSSSQQLFQHSSKAGDRRGFLQFIQESTDLAATNGERLCTRDTFLPPVHIFLYEVPHKRQKNKKRSLVLGTYYHTGKHHK